MFSNPYRHYGYIQDQDGELYNLERGNSMVWLYANGIGINADFFFEVFEMACAEFGLDPQTSNFISSDGEITDYSELQEEYYILLEELEECA